MYFTLQSSQQELLCRNAVDGADKWQKVKTETKFVQTKNARQTGKITRRNQERQSEVSISFRC